MSWTLSRAQHDVGCAHFLIVAA